MNNIYKNLHLYNIKMRFILLLCIIMQCIANAICKNCKFFKKNFLSPNKYGICLLFPIIEDNVDYLVTGKNKDATIRYHYCTTARKYDDMCGKDGKLYQENE